MASDPKIKRFATDNVRDSPLAEPIIVPCTFITGGGVESVDGITQFIGWQQMPFFGGETYERRIVTRNAMADATAQEILGAFRRALARGGH